MRDNKYKLELTRIEVPQTIFDKILNTWNYKCVDNIYQYFNGYKDYMTNYTNLNEYIILPTFRYNYILKELGYKDSIVDKNGNVQLILRCDITRDEPIMSMSGRKAYNIINKIFKKYYTIDEINDIYNNHSREYDEELSQYHYTLFLFDDSCVFKYSNVVKYDINKAHAYQLIKLFPKCEKELIYLVKQGNKYKKLGDKNKSAYYKNIFNYAVGYLVREGHRGTYNYIVQETTKLLFNAIETCGGSLVYANTDSFAVRCPNKLLQPSNSIGDFKLESYGDIYFYRDNHYYLYEFINGNDVEMRGSCLNSVRDKISLSEGIVAKYDVDSSEKYYDNNGNLRCVRKATNVRIENLKIVEVNLV